MMNRLRNQRNGSPLITLAVGVSACTLCIFIVLIVSAQLRVQTAQVKARSIEMEVESARAQAKRAELEIEAERAEAKRTPKHKRPSKRGPIQ